MNELDHVNVVIVPQILCHVYLACHYSPHLLLTGLGRRTLMCDQSLVRSIDLQWPLSEYAVVFVVTVDVAFRVQSSDDYIVVK